MHDTLNDPLELWDTFKRETHQADKDCIEERPRSRARKKVDEDICKHALEDDSG